MSQSNHLHTMDTFTRFFQENQAKFLSFAYSYIRNKTEAEDILMESMIALWENRDKWEYHQSPKNTTYRTKRLPDLYSFLKKDSFSVRVTLG